MARILVIDESQQRAVEICSGLIKAGHQVAAVLPSALEHLAVTELKHAAVRLEAADLPWRLTVLRSSSAAPGGDGQVQVWRARLQPLLADFGSRCAWLPPYRSPPSRLKRSPPRSTCRSK